MNFFYRLVGPLIAYQLPATKLIPVEFAHPNMTIRAHLVLLRTSPLSPKTLYAHENAHCPHTGNPPFRTTDTDWAVTYPVRLSAPPDRINHWGCPPERCLRRKCVAARSGLPLVLPEQGVPHPTRPINSPLPHNALDMST